jgi:argininosuccinate synthase
MAKKVSLAYSGGLDTSVIVPWLVETKGCEVHCVVADVGQGDTELEGVEEKAIRSGAKSCVIADLKREFIEDYAFPVMMANSVYEGRYLLGTSFARPIIAKAQVEHARAIGAEAVAHGCTGKGNDQVRFESTFAALAPDLEIIAPWREWTMRSREDLLAYLAARKIPCAASAEKIYSRDRNLWHISHEGGALEDPWNAPPDDMWMLTRSIAESPDRPRDVMISFESGRPVALDGVPMAGDALVAALNPIAGAHGVGRIDLIENRLVGMKSRGCYETPAGTVLYEALRGLEEIVLDRETRHERDRIGSRFAELTYYGQWFTPLREALWAAIASVAQPLTGDVVVRLQKGSARTVQRRSPNSLYDERFATFGREEVYNQAHAAGFIRLFSLPSRIAAMRAMSEEASR